MVFLNSSAITTRAKARVWWLQPWGNASVKRYFGSLLFVQQAWIIERHSRGQAIATLLQEYPNDSTHEFGEP